MRAAKMMCGQRKKPIALKKGGNPVAKSLASPALKPKVVKPKKGKGAYTRKGKSLPMSSGGSSNLRTGSKRNDELQLTKSGMQTQFLDSLASASPSEAREERMARRRRAKSDQKILAGDSAKTPAAPLKGEQTKDEKRLIDIKRRQKTESAVRKKKSEISRKGRAGGGKSVLGGITGMPAGPSNPRRKLKMLKSGGQTKSKVNEAGNYTKPSMRKNLFNKIKAGGKGGKPGQWSARKAQMLAKQYKDAGGGYRD